MIDIHQTEDGRLMFISQMTDDHLCNLIRRQLRIVKELTALISKEPMSQTRRELLSSLYNIDSNADRKDAKERLPKVVRGLYAYIAEAMLRGLSDITTDMQVAFGRTTKEDDFIKVPAPLLRLGINYEGAKTGCFTSAKIMNAVIEGLPSNDDDDDEQH